MKFKQIYSGDSVTTTPSQPLRHNHSDHLQTFKTLFNTQDKLQLRVNGQTIGHQFFQ